MARTHADALAALRQRHEEELRMLRGELEGRGREVMSARRERNALLSALRDADRRAGRAEGAAAAAGGGAAAEADRDVTGGRAPPGSREAASAPEPTGGVAFADSKSAGGDGSHKHVHAPHATVPVSRVEQQADDRSSPRGPVAAKAGCSMSSTQLGVQPEDSAGSQRGRQTHRGMHAARAETHTEGAGAERAVGGNVVRSSSQLGKRARNDSGDPAGDASDAAFGPAPTQGEGSTRWVATGAFGESRGQLTGMWLQGSQYGAANALTGSAARPRMSTHGDVAYEEARGSRRERDCCYGDWEDSDADVEVWDVHALGHRGAAESSERCTDPEVPPMAPKPQRVPAEGSADEAHAGPSVGVPAHERPAGSTTGAPAVSTGSGGPQADPATSDSDAEEDARMLERAARAARVPLDLVASADSRPSGPLQAPASAAAAGAATGVSASWMSSRHLAGTSAGPPPPAARLSVDSSVSSVQGLPRSMAQAAGVWPSARAGSAEDVVQRMRAGGHSSMHAQHSPVKWDTPAHAMDHTAPQCARILHQEDTHDGYHPRGCSAVQDAPVDTLSGPLAASSDWVSISGGQRKPQRPAGAKHAEHAQHANTDFRVLRHKQQSPAPTGRPHVHAAGGLAPALESGRVRHMHEERGHVGAGAAATVVEPPAWQPSSVTARHPSQHGTAAPPVSPGEAFAATASGPGGCGAAAACTTASAASPQFVGPGAPDIAALAGELSSPAGVYPWRSLACLPSCSCRVARAVLLVLSPVRAFSRFSAPPPKSRSYRCVSMYQNRESKYQDICVGSARSVGVCYRTAPSRPPGYVASRAMPQSELW